MPVPNSGLSTAKRWQTYLCAKGNEVRWESARIAKAHTEALMTKITEEGGIY